MARSRQSGGDPTGAGEPSPAKEAEVVAGDSPEAPSAPTFPIIGIGASAGGLEAIEELFRHMPPDTGIGFVLVQHLDPNHKSILTELVARFTRMPVLEASSGQAIQPNHVYVIPPNRELAMLNGVLQLMAPSSPRHMRLSIDYFFRSLARDQGTNAVCIVLSGAGSDGTLGLRAIKGEGGAALVQAPETAAYDSMPRSALGTGLADAVLAPRDMGQWLDAYARHLPDEGIVGRLLSEPEASSDVDRLFVLVRNRSGYDFSQYKEGTIGRRIERRIAVNRVDSLAAYLNILQKSPAELDRLWKDFLISVTQFFRNRKAMAALEGKALPMLLADHAGTEPIRIWVPGCSTGEEAYTLTMMLLDQFERAGAKRHLQVFATDIDEDALQTARLGIYPSSVAGDVPARYLRRYFLKHAQGFEMAKSLRGSIVFARHDITRDPPFSRIDLISCRNVLIYMQAPLQARVLDTLSYALRPKGMLFLGSSESIGKFSHLYESVDRRARIFKRHGMGSNGYRPIPAFPRRQLVDPPRPGPSAAEAADDELEYLTHSALLKEHTPVCVVVDDRNAVLFIHGRAGTFLEPAAGRASMNVLKMAREGLRVELASALREVAKHPQVRRVERLRVRAEDGSERRVALTVRPLPGDLPKPGAFMILFEDGGIIDHSDVEGVAATESGPAHSRRITQLERELAENRENLQNANEELETSNEELQSTIEELQSSNEELMTSQEELSSINEELQTVNVELEDKIRQLEATTDDLENLLLSTELGTIFLDVDLNVRRFTPAATRVINLISTDIGRPIDHIVHKLEYDGLVADAEQVLNSLEPTSRELRTKDGVWYSLRITVYRAGNNAVAGVVLTFIDRTEQVLAAQRFQQLLELLPDATLLSNAQGEIVQVNQLAERLFGYPQGALLGQPIEILVPEDLHVLHEQQRRQYYRKPQARPMGRPGLQLAAVRHDGSTFPADIAIGPIPNAAGSLYVATIRNSVERRRETLAIRRAHQTLEAFARWNEARFVTGADGDRALELLCHQLADVEGNGRCWVSLVEPGGTPGTRLAAHGGFTPTQATILHAGWGDPGEARSPLPLDLRGGTGLPEALKLAAAGWGCHTLLAVPLAIGERRLGFIAICASEPSAFDAAEQAQLDMLARTLAHMLGLRHASGGKA
ncbi:MAG: PAS domain-containing protein [Rhodocyclaceae bacterium]|nr:PAS domain-containing protein [Rhodocyclaceae bacterium]